MVPSDQRLDTDHLGRAQVDVGLVEHEELVALERADRSAESDAVPTVAGVRPGVSVPKNIS